jgi:putative hemolysin
MDGHRRITLEKGRYRARSTVAAQDITQAQGLRAACFNLADDADAFDASSIHILIEDLRSGALVCCYRLLPLRGHELAKSYSAQYYDLGALRDYEGQLMELGRFCIRQGQPDPDILRLAWAAMTEFVDAHDVQLLFGCSSFSGVNAESYLDTFAVLRARHLAPQRWLPRVKAPDVFRFAARLPRKPDMRTAIARMPPLLRTYLTMGGWVSDHAVVDRRMNTLHVFTGVEIDAIPATRKRLLRALV